jgi:hypothetical protein
LRQRPSRYTIRAGRNLPDKEFRSDSLTPFPEEPDFIFSCLYSYLKLWPESSRFLLAQDAFQLP